METPHVGSGNRICTVVFVDIVQYSEQVVSDQVQMKSRFSALVGDALEHTPVADRLVVDTGDGAALCFLGAPEDALFAANSLRSRVLQASPPHGLRLRLGINLGPVRVVKDINGRTNVIGDGINVAQRVMSFADPNQILVSRSYYEVVSRLSPEYGQLFQYAGMHRDKHVREHEVYEVQLSPWADLHHEAEADSAPVSAAAVPRPAAGGGPAAQFDAALLGRLTTALVREIGPVAKLLVRRAAERAPDAATLCQTLADSVPASHRDSFLASLADVTRGRAGDPADVSGAPRTTGRGPAGPHGVQTEGLGGEIGPDLLARAEQLLARHIGPLARILVREAAQHAVSPRDLFERLALHIDNAEVRKFFVAQADRTDRRDRPGR
jgi:class 3 adenylate cyclase